MRCARSVLMARRPSRAPLLSPRHSPLPRVACFHAETRAPLLSGWPSVQIACEIRNVSVPNLDRLRRLSHSSSRLLPSQNERGLSRNCVDSKAPRPHAHALGRPRWRRRREEHKHAARRAAEQTLEFLGFRKSSLRFAHLGHIRRDAHACECCAFHGSA